LVSVGTAASLSGALVGAALALALTDLSQPVAVLVGGVVGWVLSSLILGAAAERLDRRLHRMGGTRVFRRRRR
jgi:phosphate/sulfate permease